MITSMNSNELYKTLVGHYKPNCQPPVSSEPVKAVKAYSSVPENAIKIGDMPVYKDFANEPNIDRFILTDKLIDMADVLAEIGKNEIKELPYEASDVIDFGYTDIRTELRKGSSDDVPTKERIAEFYGDMAKRLDEAYAEGKFTEEEYKELDEMILNRAKKDAGVFELKKASYALYKETGSLFNVNDNETISRKQSEIPKEFKAAQEKLINKVEKYYKYIDLASLMELFNSIRFGK
ncbi:MAG: hypothetical protein NC395_10640 [Prevotella sp.]|nr:hypothetical protein [Prevotella sp.]